MIGSEKKIKVMHVAECIGGVDRYLQSLLKYMDHDKFENVMVLSKLYENKGYEGLADKVEIVDIPHGMGVQTIFSSIKIRKLIKKYSPDVIFAHSSVAGATTRLAGIGRKCKIIYNPHGWSFNIKSGKAKIYTFLEKMMAPFCDAIVCISDAEKKSALNKEICKADKLHVIYNGIDLEEYKATKITRRELNIPADAFVVGMVGRISQQKAPDIFVRMAKEVAEKIDNTYFVIVGDVVESDKDERTYIEKLANEAGIKLMISGWVNNPLDYVQQFDVACLLSRWEGFGLVIPEYMLCGKPVVATRVDAIPYLIEDGVNGLLVEVDDYKAAAAAICRLQNKKLKDKFIDEGIKTVYDKFDARRVANEIQELTKRMLR